MRLEFRLELHSADDNIFEKNRDVKPELWNKLELWNCDKITGQHNQLYVKQSKHHVQMWFHPWQTTVLQLRQPRPHRKQIIHKLSHQFYLVRLPAVRVNSQKVIFCLVLFRTNLFFRILKSQKNLILLIVQKMDYWMVKWILNPVVWKTKNWSHQTSQLFLGRIQGSAHKKFHLLRQQKLLNSALREIVLFLLSNKLNNSSLVI